MSNSGNKSPSPKKKKKKFFSLSFHFKVCLTAEWCVCYLISGTSSHVDRFQETFCREYFTHTEMGKLLTSGSLLNLMEEEIKPEWFVNRKYVMSSHIWISQPQTTTLPMDPWVQKTYCHHCTQLDAQHLYSLVCFRDLLHRVGVGQTECGLRQKP